MVTGGLWLAWQRLRGTVSMALFGLSGSLVAGSAQHVVQTCKGNCLGCGSCALALAGAVVAASAGVAERTSGRRRWLLLALTALAGLALYYLLSLYKRGLLPFQI